MVKLKLLKNIEGIDISEKDLQKLFEKDLDSIESGLKYVGSFVNIGTGIIDILAIDEEKNPVIIECKKVGNFDRDALIQLMNYYSWFATDENHIHHLLSIFEGKGFKDISRDIRLIALVSEVSDEVKNACWALKAPIKLITFSLSKLPNDDEVIVVPRLLLDTSLGGESFVYPPKNEDDHFKANAHMRPLYEKLKKAVLEIDKGIKVNPSPQDYIGFVARKNFCGVHVKKNWLRLDLQLTPEEARNSKYKSSENWGGWGYYHLENESNLTEALDLVKKAFDKSLQV